MPLLTYTSSDFPFVPFTKIYSADINQCYNDIKTLLNTTGLDYLNVQTHGLKRYTASSNLAAGTPNFALYNDVNGDMTEAAYLPPAQGGTGANLTPSGPIQAGQAVVVNPTGTGFMLSAQASSTSNLYAFYNLGMI